MREVSGAVDPVPAAPSPLPRSVASRPSTGSTRPPPTPTLRNPPPSQHPTRDDLLGQIRQGVTLKHVVESEGAAAPASDIGGMIENALQKWMVGINGMSSSDESEGEEEDEWEDSAHN